LRAIPPEPVRGDSFPSAGSCLLCGEDAASRPCGTLKESFIVTPFEKLGLSADLLRAIAEQGYTEPTPIQAQAIPVVLAGRDLLAAAQTGTGKTAGFTLPMLQLLTNGTAPQGGKSARHPVRALVLVPTRELAAQVQESVRDYGRHLKLRAAVIFGGVGFQPQADELKRGVDIVVATPGRLLDHIAQETIDLSHVKILVLDEADRMLDMGFIHDIRRVLGHLPAERQNLLFSATFPEAVRTLANGFMRDPATVEVAPPNVPIELIRQVVHPVDKERKRHLLAHLVKTNDWHQVLVFTRTKHGANRLVEDLERDGIEAAAIHGNKSQPQRTKALKRFKDNELQVLVATDIAARGIDIEGLPHVVNYDLPQVAEDYVHRIGRTGRAGEPGHAVSLVCAEDRAQLRDIEKLTSRTIKQEIVAGFEPNASGAQESAPAQEQRRRQRNQRPQRGAGGNQPAPAGAAAPAGQRQSQRRRGRGGQQPSGPRAEGQQPSAPRSDGQQPQRPASGGQPQPRRGKQGGQQQPRGNGNAQQPQQRGRDGQQQRQRRGNSIGAQPSNRGRPGGGQQQPFGRGEKGRPGQQGQQRPALAALPFEDEQARLKREQLEYHRRQQAASGEEEQPSTPKPKKAKALSALFTAVRRKFT
jgi:ATP-dependent RNA helicase RhlE